MVIKMNKFERFTTFLTLAGLIIAVLAWLFPRSPTDNKLDIYTSSKISTVFKENQPLLNTQPYSLTTKTQERKPFEPIVTELTFDSFYQQLQYSGLDSGKIAFIRKSRRLFSQNMEFKEFLLALNTISLDSNKLEAIELLRPHINTPTGTDLEVLADQFSLSSNRHDAFNLPSKN